MPALRGFRWYPYFVAQEQLVASRQANDAGRNFWMKHYIKSFPYRSEHVRTYILWMYVLAENYEHTHTHTHTRESHSVDNNKD